MIGHSGIGIPTLPGGGVPFGAIGGLPHPAAAEAYYRGGASGAQGDKGAAAAAAAAAAAQGGVADAAGAISQGDYDGSE